MKPIIGLTGFKGSGKDTAAQAFDNWYPYAFAEPMRRALCALYNLPPSLLTDPTLKEKPIAWIPDNPTPRGLMRSIGAWGRSQPYNLWLLMAEREYQKYVEDSDYDGMVITDVRMDDEAHWIKYKHGKIIEITRPGKESDGHETEQRLWEEHIDHTVVNDGTVEELHDKIRGLL